MQVKAVHALNDQFEGEVNLIVVIEKINVLERLYESIKKLPSMKRTLVLSVCDFFPLFIWNFNVQGDGNSDYISRELLSMVARKFPNVPAIFFGDIDVGG